jgi:hypothetical protein
MPGNDKDGTLPWRCARTGEHVKLRTMVFLALVLPAAAHLYPSATAADAQKNTVWRIGRFDRSSMEFAEGSPEKPVSFVVGHGNPAKDWYAVQPVGIVSGSEAQNVSNGSAPWVIRFSLPEAPVAAYTLHFALLVESASVPMLQVTINGRRGSFYLHPRLDFENGDQSSASDAVYSHADVAFSFPGSYLHRGDNVITLQAVAQAEQHVPDASLNWDAIELDSSPGRRPLQEPSVQIVPTMFSCVIAEKSRPVPAWTSPSTVGTTIRPSRIVRILENRRSSSTYRSLPPARVPNSAGILMGARNTQKS